MDDLYFTIYLLLKEYVYGLFYDAVRVILTKTISMKKTKPGEVFPVSRYKSNLNDEDKDL